MRNGQGERVADRVLFIRPTGPCSAEPVEDALSQRMATLLRAAVRGPAFRGRHYAACGARSTNCDLYLPGGQVANSLAVHYLRHHRSDVPADELAKVAAL